MPPAHDAPRWQGTTSAVSAVVPVAGPSPRGVRQIAVGTAVSTPLYVAHYLYAARTEATLAYRRAVAALQSQMDGFALGAQSATGNQTLEGARLLRLQFLNRWLARSSLALTWQSHHFQPSLDHGILNSVFVF